MPAVSFMSNWNEDIENYYTHYSNLVLLQYEKVMKFISKAKAEGATILCGGERPQVKFLNHSLCQGGVW